ncbi:hypothetical protein [Evansella clarkii]|uniref:hypothetical protein n=1 Tax=Evansella clarkii TaxID=79879 RepID=UPI00099604A7|nr:hypothetical protein [Evansella clarkii]
MEYSSQQIVLSAHSGTLSSNARETEYPLAFFTWDEQTKAAQKQKSTIELTEHFEKIHVKKNSKYIKKYLDKENKLKERMIR